MASKNTQLALLGLGILVLTIGYLYYRFAQKIAVDYKEANATWRIQGLCVNAKTGAPITSAEITVFFTEPVTFKHHWRNPPPLKSTNVVTRTDDQGHFDVVGEGGHAYITAQAKGYREQYPWENWRYYARGRISRVDTNVTVRLDPIPTPIAAGKTSTQ